MSENCAICLENFKNPSNIENKKLEIQNNKDLINIEKGDAFEKFQF